MKEPLRQKFTTLSVHIPRKKIRGNKGTGKNKPNSEVVDVEK